MKIGYQVDIWTVSRELRLRSNKCNIDGVNVWQPPRWRYPHKHDGGYSPIDILFRMKKAIIGYWDIIHGFEHRPNVLFPWLIFFLKRKVQSKQPIMLFDWSDWWTNGGIVTNKRENKYLDQIEKYLEEDSKKLSDGVTVISKVLWNRATNIGIDSKNILYLPAGAAIEKFPIMDKKYCRNLVGIPKEKFLLGFIGFSLWDVKLLVEIFKRIKSVISNVRLLVIGGGVEEKSLDILRENLKDKNDLIITGTISFSDVPTYLEACDVLLLPMENNLANQARIPNKLLDYYAAGRPIVVSDVGDTGEWIKKHDTGIAAEDNEESFANACITLLMDQQRSEDCGRRARTTAENELSYHALTQTLLDFYKLILERRSR